MNFDLEENGFDNTFAIDYDTEWSFLTRSSYGVEPTDAGPQPDKGAPCILSSVLTGRELEVVRLILDGYTNRYIASKLFVTEGTVKRTAHNAYKKLNVSSRVELIKMYSEHN